MPRPTKCRWVGLNTDVTYFKPRGVPLRSLEEVALTIEELEAIRLKDLEGLDQQSCADRMRISRPTFHRVLRAAHAKIADALTTGKAIRIGGGHHVYYGGESEGAGHTGTGEPSVGVRENAGEARAVRIAVSAMGPGLQSQVDERFGWCTHFVVCDADDPEASAESHENPALAGASGAGIAAAQFVDGLGVKVVLTGSLGPNAARVTNAAGIQGYALKAGMTVGEAIAFWKAGELPKM